MNSIQCPKCGEVFKVDESSYAELLSQVRNHEFQKEIDARLKAVEAEKEQERALALARLENEYKTKLSELDKKVATSQQEKEAALASIQSEYQVKILALENQLKEKDLQTKLSLGEAVKEKDVEIQKKESELELLKQSHELEIAKLKTEEELLLKQKEAEVAYYKDLKARMSTKMIGESLEQHCLAEFNSIRAVAFPKAYFEKDNEISTSGSKGDFIYRETDEDGVEIISIMFEMKNEADETATKHKNEDFFKELDKDRKEKKCEYAILVSMLEGDSELYNQGIVDVSHRYPKMYVIRPQFFIPIISLLRNAALNSLLYKKELVKSQQEHVDLVNFEAEMETFKEGFSRNFGIAKDKFDNAIAEIDKAIGNLQKIKDSLTSSTRQLGLANDKAQSLSIKKLAKNSPNLLKEAKALSQKKAEEE